MGRKSNLTEAQWEAIRQRMLKGEPSRSIAKDFPISAGAIRQRFGKIADIAAQSDQVQETARKLADAQLALQALPPVNRAAAVDLAASLQAISASLARTAELSSKTAHRLASLANSEAAKVDDANPMMVASSVEALKGVAALTKMANDASSVGLNLLNANRDRVAEAPQDVPRIDPTKLSDATLAELMNAAEPR